MNFGIFLANSILFKAFRLVLGPDNVFSLWLGWRSWCAHTSNADPSLDFLCPVVPQDFHGAFCSDGDVLLTHVAPDHVRIMERFSGTRYEEPRPSYFGEELFLHRYSSTGNSSSLSSFLVRPLQCGVWPVSRSRTSDNVTAHTRSFGSSFSRIKLGSSSRGGCLRQICYLVGLPKWQQLTPSQLSCGYPQRRISPRFPVQN